MNFTPQQKKNHNQALHKYMTDNNNGRGIQNGGSITFPDKTIKVFKSGEQIASFLSDVSIQDNIGPGYFCLVIENQEEITSVAGKIFFWPTKYIITYNGFLTIEDESIKILVS